MAQASVAALDAILLTMNADSSGRWTRPGDEAEGFVVSNRLVAVIYSENVGEVDETDPQRGIAYELWWVPVDEPDAREVLFGVGNRADDAWATRWERARAAGEWLYTERLAARSSGDI